MTNAIVSVFDRLRLTEFLLVKLHLLTTNGIPIPTGRWKGALTIFPSFIVSFNISIEYFIYPILWQKIAVSLNYSTVIVPSFVIVPEFSKSPPEIVN
jgi:hypothetical protein